MAVWNLHVGIIIFLVVNNLHARFMITKYYSL